MELKHIVAATAAVLATSAFAGGDRVHQRSEASSGYYVSESQSMQSPAVVRQVELQLNSRGYDAGPADGAFDRQTQEGLRQFQQAQNLSPSGQIDRPTLAALGIVSSERIAQAPVPGTWGGPDSSSTAGVGNATNSTNSRPWGSHAPQD